MQIPEEIKEPIERIAKYMAEKELSSINWVIGDFEMTIRAHKSGMKQAPMEWKQNIIKKNQSYYVLLPHDYCKANNIQGNNIVLISLEQDKTLNLKIRKPLMNKEEK